MARPRLSMTWLNERVQVSVGGIIASLWMKQVKGWRLTEHDIDRLIKEAIRRDLERRKKDPDYDAKVNKLNENSLKGINGGVRDKSSMTMKGLLKLLQYVLTVDDVEIYVRTTKKDPIFKRDGLPQEPQEDEILNITELKKKGLLVSPNHVTACVRVPSNMMLVDDDDQEEKK